MLLVALLVAIAAPAEAVIVPQRSIAGVALDMTRTEVKQVVGEPVTRRRVEDLVIWTFPGKLRVLFTDRAKAVTSVVTESRGERTRSGIGVGSTRKQVRRALKGEYCSPFDCSLGTLAHRSRNTMFGFGADRTGPVEFVEVRRQFVDGMP
jgi:hypothetical protein